jgi:hypothetical protein
MAVTFSAPVEGATAVAALSVGTLVAQLSDGEGRARSFIPPVAPQSGTAATAVYPAIVSVSAVSYDDGTGVNDPHVGPVKLVLKPGTADTVNVGSPLVFTLDQNAAVTTVSGTY